MATSKIEGVDSTEIDANILKALGSDWYLYDLQAVQEAYLTTYFEVDIETGFSLSNEEIEEKIDVLSVAAKFKEN